MKYIELIRAKHYVKNLLVFAPLICSGELLNIDKLSKAIYGFLAFCAVSSIVYIINDLKDVEKDRNHPTKCHRPIASGRVTKKESYICLIVLAILAIIFNYLCFNLYATLFLTLYLLLNLAYSFGLKNKPIVDIAILVSGFVIRIIYGSLITGIEISSWLYLTIFALSCYFALGKRRNELRQIKTDTRSVLKYYNDSFLNMNMYMCLAIAIIFYALWTMDSYTVLHYGSDKLVLTVPIIMIIAMKYSLDIEGQSDGDPVEVLLKDKVLIAICLIYALIMFALLYM